MSGASSVKSVDGLSPAPSTTPWSGSAFAGAAMPLLVALLFTLAACGPRVAPPAAAGDAASPGAGQVDSVVGTLRVLVGDPPAGPPSVQVILEPVQGAALQLDPPAGTTWDVAWLRPFEGEQVRVVGRRNPAIPGRYRVIHLETHPLRP